MPDARPERTRKQLVEVVRAVGCRAIIYAGDLLPEGQKVAPDILAVGALPHARLFPRVALALHHGGAGTSARAARAGIPQVILPHVLDQFPWSSRIAERGLGPKPIFKYRPTAGLLAARIREALEDSGMRQRAARLARALAGRDGAAHHAQVAGQGQLRLAGLEPDQALLLHPVRQVVLEPQGGRPRAGRVDEAERLVVAHLVQQGQGRLEVGPGRLGVAGLALAFSSASIINLILLWFWLKLEIGWLDDFKIFISTLKFSLAALICGVAVQAIKLFIGNHIDMTRLLGVLAQGLFAGLSGILIYLLVC